MDARKQILGVKHFKGTGKESGRAYEFARVIVAVEPRVNGPVVAALGYEAAEWDAEPSVLQSLRSVTFPTECDLQLNIGGDGKVRVLSARVVSAGPKAATA